MDPQSIQSIIFYAQLLMGFIFLMVCLNLYLVFRLKDIDPFEKWNPNNINGALFMVFCIVGLIAAFASSGAWLEKMILVHTPASEHGVEIDRMFRNTMIVATFVTVVTNFLLFFFSWKYRGKEGRKALYYPHNNRLEIVWTAIPAIVLILLVGDGIITWNQIMGDEPDNPVQIEVTGEQFQWTFRYPGPDGKYGRTHVSFIDIASGNLLGFDTEDPAGRDDIIARELHLPVNRNIAWKIKSKDVLHSATLAHFRVKMDAVPGMPTHFNFKPTVTTEEMRKKTGNEEFNYEMSCQQICGASHWNMNRRVIVEEQSAFDAWLKEQTPFYTEWKATNGGDNSTADAEIEETDDSEATASEEGEVEEGRLSMIQ